jgi:quinohemoprotein ethanol dehydrogenase
LGVLRCLTKAAACLAAGSVLALGANPATAQSSADWTGHGNTAFETNYATPAQITPGTVSRLGLAWSLDLPGEASLEATPVEVGGIIYFTGSYGAVYAADVKTGKLLWKFDPQTWKYNPAKLMTDFGVNRGPAYDHGRIFSAVTDGRLVALDAKTGKLLWGAQTTPMGGMVGITGAPRTFRGKVIIGNSGADVETRGYVTAYDQATGKQLWRFYVVPGSPDQNKGDPVMQAAAKTWNGPFWKGGGGGNPWDAITFDPDLNRIYVGTANASPENPDTRSPGGGTNLFTASIVALDADTGKYIWHYQMVPRDTWDYDCTQQMTLADLKIDGKLTKVLMQAPKNGFFYVLDRENGRLISAEKITKTTWASRIDLKTGLPVEAPGQRFEGGSADIWPSSIGAHSWQAMSYDPQTGLVYIPTMHEGMRLSHGPAKPGEIENGGTAIGIIPILPPEPKATLLAWNPLTQKPAWKIDQSTMWNGGALATAGGLVFQGTADGYMSAYDAKTGAKLWRFYSGLGIIAAPISYTVDGTQYVSVLVGYGANAAIDGPNAAEGWSFAAPRRLLTFSLDGKAVLPPSPPQFAKLQLLDDPTLKLDPAQVAAGSAMYLACAACHGRDAIGAGGPAPDLRASPIAFNPGALWAVVHEGALLPRGMPLILFFNHDQVMDIYAYIRSQARAGLAQQAAAAK